MPIACPICKPAVYVYKYSMPEHFRLEHSSHEFPPALSVTGAEKKAVFELWQQIQKKRPTAPAPMTR